MGDTGSLALGGALGIMAVLIHQPLVLVIAGGVFVAEAASVMLQTGYLTPPMAPSIFYLRGIAPPEVKLHHMYTGIWPFIALQLLVVGLLIANPKFVTWLPSVALTGVH